MSIHSATVLTDPNSALSCLNSCWYPVLIFSLTSFFQTEDGGDAQEFHPPDDKSLPDENLIEVERNRTIEKAIATLPDKYRAPIVLREIQELSYEEIAQILGLGLGTTKSRISRARALLREKLKQYFD